MKLKLIERKPGRPIVKVPGVSITRKGAFSFNRSAMDLFGIETSKRINMYRDEEDPQKWFVGINENGYANLPRKKKERNGQVNMADIAHMITASFYHTGKGALRFTIGEKIETASGTVYPLNLVKDSLEMELPKKDNSPYEFSK